MYRIFIVEDDPGIAGAIVEQAGQWGYEARSAKDFRDVMSEFAEYDPQLVLLDVSLPFYNGYHWCQEIRRTSQVPVIFISSASDSMNIVMAMNMGGDDFIAKPFDMSVLTAKIQAILRRSYDLSAVLPPLEHRGAVLSRDDTVMTYNGESIPLTKNEYRILGCLMRNQGKIVSREKLMETLWATDSFIDDNTLTVNINRLRRKLDAAGLNDFIVTKFGIGYMIP